MIENVNAGSNRPRAGALGRLASESPLVETYDMNAGVSTTSSYGGGAVRVTADYVGPAIDVPVEYTAYEEVGSGTGIQTMLPALPASCNDCTATVDANATSANKLVANTLTETPLPAAPSTIPWLLIGAIALTTYFVVKSPTPPAGLGSLEPAIEPTTLGRPARKSPPKRKSKKHVDSLVIS